MKRLLLSLLLGGAVVAGARVHAQTPLQNDPEYRAEYAPWLASALALENGQAGTEQAAASLRRTRVQNLSTQLRSRRTSELQAGVDWARRHGVPFGRIPTNGGMLTFFRLPDGSVLATNLAGRCVGRSQLIGLQDGRPRYYQTCNLNAAKTISADRILPGGDTGLNLTGRGTIIGHWDAGLVWLDHQEFSLPSQHVVWRDLGLDIDDHATHVAGTLASSGVEGFARGMAPEARVFNHFWDNDLPVMALEAATQPMRISNHSYGLETGWNGVQIFVRINEHGEYQVDAYSYWAGDPDVSILEDYKFGFYSEDARLLDQLTYATLSYLPVWAAGNERSESACCPGGVPGPAVAFSPSRNAWVFLTNAIKGDLDDGGYDTLPPHGCAKNVLTVTAVDDVLRYNGPGSVQAASFTSMGPTDDGRIKPDIAANGVDVTSVAAFTRSDYVSMSGTSMAAPCAAGGLDLLVELHTRLNGSNALPLWSSTLRGLAIHCADEAGPAPGPDYELGWGLLNVQRAALLMQSNVSFGTSPFLKEIYLKSGTALNIPVVSDGRAPLKVTICWADPAGPALPPSVDPTNRVLVNDLDLRVTRPGETNLPWVLDPSHPWLPATRGNNDRDNIEQVVIDRPVAGSYSIQVTSRRALLGENGSPTLYQPLTVMVSGNVPDAARPLAIERLTRWTGLGYVGLRWKSIVGAVYRLESTDRIDGNWLAATSDIQAVQELTSAVVPAPTSARRFYRITRVR